MGAITVGIDIGQKHDPTAIAVAEMEWRTDEERTEDHHIVRFLQRLPLGTQYPAVASRLREMIANVHAHGAPLVAVFMDATGVGQPVVDEVIKSGVHVTPVYFTHGDRRTVNEDRSITLGKAYMVSRLKALMQSGRIHLPRTDEMDAMQKELLDYEIRVSEDANERYGAFKVGTHDDLVTAIGLAVQVTPQVPFASLPGAVANWEMLNARLVRPSQWYDQ